MAGRPEPLPGEQFARRLEDIESRLMKLEHGHMAHLNEEFYTWAPAEGRLTFSIADADWNVFSWQSIGVIPTGYTGTDVLTAKAFAAIQGKSTNGVIYVRLRDSSNVEHASTSFNTSAGNNHWITLQWLHPWKTTPNDNRLKPGSSSDYRTAPPNRLYWEYQRVDDGGSYTLVMNVPFMAKWGDPEDYPLATSAGYWTDEASGGGGDL